MTIAARTRVTVWLVAGWAAVSSGAYAQSGGWGVLPDDFAWRRPSADSIRAGLLVLLCVALVVLAAYLAHLVAKHRRTQRASRALSVELDRIHGYVDNGDLLQPGTRVDIEVEHRGAQRLYRSVVDSVDARSAELVAPREEGATVPLRVGQRVAVIVRRSTYSYRFETRVLARRRGRVPTVTVLKRRRALRFQRREFLRIGVAIEATVQFRVQGAQETGQPHTSSGRIVDLSGSGIRVDLSTNVKHLRFFTVRFGLPDSKRDRVSAECLAVPANARRHGQHGGMTVGAHFIQISRKDRERVIRHVRELERKRRKRDVERRYDESEKARAQAESRAGHA